MPNNTHNNHNPNINAKSRADFFKHNPKATAYAALDAATNMQKQISPGAIQFKPGQFKGKSAIIIGAGVAGLTTAYELLAQSTGMDVTILEAQNRTGGRCLSLRTGDTITEDKDSQLFGSSPGQTQTVRFEQPEGDAAPYLNAGPGRIPSAHKRLLSYLKKFAVDIEVYVMNSDANLIQKDGGPFASLPLTYRRLDHNTRGWLAQLVFENAQTLLQSESACIPKAELDERTEQLQNLMISFGELTTQGRYDETAGEDGMENARSRAGYTKLPGVDAGETAEALSLNSLLESTFWEDTSFYQPSDFLWQPTLFQPVGGMDQVQKAFAREVAALGADMHLNSPVKNIAWDADKQKFVVSVEQMGCAELITYEADYCFSNMAIPFLSKLLADDLQNPNIQGGFDSDFKQALQGVYQAQFAPEKNSDVEATENGYIARFLACTTKVGWQADRHLWQGSGVQVSDHSCGDQVSAVPDSEVGVVPIFGGISRTDNDITQIWYPSNDYHDQKGILTGVYNYSSVAYKSGNQNVEERLIQAKDGAAVFGQTFADGLDLKLGVAVAWQNMPHIKGGWAQWHTVDQEFAVDYFNTLTQATGIQDATGNMSDPKFFIVGDQLSSLPGWQEGAIASALQALSRLARPDLAIAHLSCLPDTRLMVEGV